MRYFRNGLSAAAVSVIILTACCNCRGAAENHIQFKQTDDGFVATDDGQKVFFYQRTPKSLDGKYSRADYIHPLYSLDGDVLTEDFPPDHPHHRGVFWAWHQVWIGDKKIGDSWSATDFVWDVREAKTVTLNSEARALRVYVYWRSPQYTDSDGKQTPFVKEITTITVHHATDNMRMIDFQIEVLALRDDMRLGGSEDAKGYGGFTTRIRLPKGLEFTGTHGPVEPTNLSVEAGPWLDFSGKLGGSDKTSGLSILCHESDPGYPQRWILRRQGSAQNPVYPGRKPVPLSRVVPLTLRYRLIVHRGDVHDIDLDKLQAEYNAEPSFQLLKHQQ